MPKMAYLVSILAGFWEMHHPCLYHVTLKNKERAVAEFIISNFPDFTWVADKYISGSCSK